MQCIAMCGSLVHENIECCVYPPSGKAMYSLARHTVGEDICMTPTNESVGWHENNHDVTSLATSTFVQLCMVSFCPVQTGRL